MSQSRPRILVIGCGSIGERHLRAILATGRADAIACDNREAIRSRIASTYGVPTLADWRQGREALGVTAALVATPAPSHVEIAKTLLEAGLDVFIEKPLAIAFDGVEALTAAHKRSGKFAAVAYIYHSVPVIIGARKFLQQGQFGRVRHVTVTAGQHFPSFRPAYREIYYRDHAQGGGAIQDALTHLANVVEWVVGPTTRLYCHAAHQVLEGVDVEDTVNVSAVNGDALVSYALNQFQAPNEIRLDFHAERGSVRVEIATQTWGTLAHGEAAWTWHPAPVENRDVLFAQQMSAFLDACEGKPNLLCTIEEAAQTLRFNLAALQSWRQRVPVEIAAVR